MMLQEIFAGCTAKPLLAEEPMAKHTSFRIGGPADLMAMPQSEQELQQLLQLLLALRHSHQIGRTADAEGCMLRHRLLCQQRLGSTACENLLQHHYFSPIASLTTS